MTRYEQFIRYEVDRLARAGVKGVDVEQVVETNWRYIKDFVEYADAHPLWHNAALKRPPHDSDDMSISVRVLGEDCGGFVWTCHFDFENGAWFNSAGTYQINIRKWIEIPNANENV